MNTHMMQVQIDVPGINDLEGLIREHKELVDALYLNMSKINQTISGYKVIVKEETTGDIQ